MPRETEPLSVVTLSISEKGVNFMIDKKLLSLLVCPVTKAPVEYIRESQELVCWSSGLVYPIRDGIPVMLEGEARQLSLEEKEKHDASRKAAQQKSI